MTERTVDVRPITASDRADWARLWDGYLAFYETTTTAQVRDTYFARLIGNDPQDFNGLIATVDGRAVGLVHYLFHRHGWKIEDVCYLQDLYADPDVRGQGIGRKLIKAVYDAADRAGAPSVYWLTQTGNETARRLYDRIAQPTDFMKYQRVVA